MIDRRHAIALLALLAVGLSGCGGATSEPQVSNPQAGTAPADGGAGPNQAVSRTSAATTTANTGVVWEVVEGSGGAVDATGHYTAPATAGQFHVRVSSRADSTLQALATVTVTATSAGSGGKPLTVSGRNILDGCGGVLQARGVEQIFGVRDVSGNGPFSLGGSYTALVDEVAATGANAIRILPQSDLPAASVDAIISRAALTHGMVVYVSNNGSSTDPNHASSQTWLSQADIKAVLQKPEYLPWLIIDALQEPGSSTRATWRANAIARIADLRNQGYTQPFTVMANVDGRDLPSLTGADGAAVVASDPLGKTILNWQAYWGQSGYYQGLYGMSLAQGIAAAAAAPYPIQIGLVNLAESTCTDPVDVAGAMAAAQSGGLGWLYWDYWLPGYTCFDLTSTGSAAARTAAGQTVIAGAGGTLTAPMACAAPSVAVAISPSAVTLDASATTTFTATVTGTASTGKSWSVRETTGCGSITSAGVYTAPGTGATCHVVATSQADPTRSATATVTVRTPVTVGGQCDSTPPRTTGTTYYYCDCGTGAAAGCVAGNDANAGTSPSAPRRTLGDAATRFGAMASGSTVALCRGGVWTSSNFGYLPNKSCGTADSTWCDIRDYVPTWGNSSTPKPLVNLGSGGFGLAFVNSTSGVRLWNVAFRSTTSNHDAGDGMVGVYDSASGLDICNVTVEGGKVGFNIQSSGTLPSTMRQSTVTLIGQTGIYHAASNWTFDGNLFLNNQQANAGGQCGGYCGSYYNHDHYVSGVASNVVIKNSEYASTDGRGSGVVIYWTDFQTNPVFENNYVHSNGNGDNYAFSSSNNAANTSNYNGIIRRNRFVMPNARTAVEISACTGCQFLDNFVQVSATGAHGLGVPEQTGQSNPVNSGTIVRNNTFYLAGSGEVGIAQGPEGSGYVFENNVVYGAAGSTCYSITRPLATGHPFTVTSYPSTGTNTAGNYCVNSGAPPSVVFVDAPGGNFKPVAGGPLVGTANQTYYSPTAIGTTAWSSSDTGATRTVPVDIGAFVH